MASPSPLPVIVTSGPGTDWWANLANGFLGALVAAVVGGLVSFLVARYVVQQTKRADREQARELAALAAAEELGEACLDAVEAMERHFRAGGNFAARDAWSRAVARKSPSLRGYVDTTTLAAFIWELDRHAVLADALQGRHADLRLDPDTGKLVGAELLEEEWRASWLHVTHAGAVIETLLVDFREAAR